MMMDEADVAAVLPSLDAEALRRLRAVIDDLLDSRSNHETDLGENIGPQSEPIPLNERGNGGPGRPAGVPAGAWLEEKMISGCGPYLYWRWMEGKIKRSKYAGKK